jgi:hypothetical protein
MVWYFESDIPEVMTAIVLIVLVQLLHRAVTTVFHSPCMFLWSFSLQSFNRGWNRMHSKLFIYNPWNVQPASSGSCFHVVFICTCQLLTLSCTWYFQEAENVKLRNALHSADHRWHWLSQPVHDRNLESWRLICLTVQHFFLGWKVRRSFELLFKWVMTQQAYNPPTKMK